MSGKRARCWCQPYKLHHWTSSRNHTYHIYPYLFLALDLKIGHATMTNTLTNSRMSLFNTVYIHINQTSRHETFHQLCSPGHAPADPRADTGRENDGRPGAKHFAAFLLNLLSTAKKECLRVFSPTLYLPTFFMNKPISFNTFDHFYGQFFE